MKTIVWIGVILFLFHTKIAQAQDTTWVQTLTFDDITKRRGVWEFPSDQESYRKILMYYTLKCDEKTTIDEYACGEWDYLTNSIVYDHLGFDSTILRTFKFHLNGEHPDTIKYVSEPMLNYLQKKQEYREVVSSANIEFFNLGVGTATDSIIFNTNEKQNTTQILYKADELSAAGLTSGLIQEIGFDFSKLGKDLNNLKIRIRQTSNDELNEFYSAGFKLVYEKNTLFTNTGLNRIVLTEPYEWDGISNLIFEFSFENFSTASGNYLMGHEVSYNALLNFKNNDAYYSTNGKDKYINCQNITTLNKASEFTIEGWFNVHDWAAWKDIVSKGSGGKILLQTGTEEGQLFCIIRNGANTHGNAKKAIELNTWNHIAMVYNGNGSNNSQKLKLFVNGKQVTLSYNGQIPVKTHDNTDPLLLHRSKTQNIDYDNFRVWSKALTQSEIKSGMFSEINNEHPSFDFLVGEYLFDQVIGEVVPNNAGSKFKALLVGEKNLNYYTPEHAFKNVVSSTIRPNLSIYTGDYQSEIKEQIVVDTIIQTPIALTEYEIGVHEFSLVSSVNVWEAGSQLLLNTEGEILEEINIDYDSELINEKLITYTKPVEIIEEYEIGRFITPYGIGLDLGEHGYTWIYDVTDYEPLLHGSVDLRSGNAAELIDLKFAFVKGTPAREVISIDKVWGKQKAYKYKDLAANTKLSGQKMNINSEAEQMVLRTIVTGHGHASNDGSYPHCCEWKDNTHYMYANGNLASEWHIWQTYDCAENPLYPQGGTWPGSREGWCPGDKVKHHDIDVTPFVQGDTVVLDYDITDVPENNLAMGNGAYHIEMQLFQYKKANYEIDAEIVDIISPNNFEIHSRNNPTCINPKIVIKNSGSEKLTSLKINYSVKGGDIKTYNWTGNLNFMESEKIVLPAPEPDFWINEENVFEVYIENPNQLEDQNTDNNTLTTEFNLPDLYNEEIIILLKTRNMYSQYMSYKILNDQGDVVKEYSALVDSKVYTDTFRLDNGCYTFEIIDEANWGLDYWAIQNLQGGSLAIKNAKGLFVKRFEPEFGHRLTYAFKMDKLDYIQEANIEQNLSLYPNPSDGEFTITLQNFHGSVNIAVYNLDGQVVFNDAFYQDTYFEQVLNLSHLPIGTYIVKAFNNKALVTKKLIIK